MPPTAYRQALDEIRRRVEQCSPGYPLEIELDADEWRAILAAESALRTALAYVDRVAGTAPTEPSRVQRQRQAASDAAMIRRLLGDLCAPNEKG